MTPKSTPPAVAFQPGVKTKHFFNDGTQVNVLRSNIDSYVMTKRITQGGFGKLRYAMNRSGRLFAVKEFRMESRRSPRVGATQPTSPQQLSAEVRAVRQWSSIPVHDVVDVKGKVHMMTPLMRGSLHALQTSMQPALRPTLARYMLYYVSQQLLAMQQQGYVHRDIKDSNILFNERGQFCLCDFGMVTAAQAMTTRGGTWGYMPPEYSLRSNQHPTYDVFSLGICLLDIYARALRPDPRGRDDNHTASASFVQWRAHLLDPRTGHLDIQRIGSSLFWSREARAWNKAFRCMRDADPTLCQFVLTHMLEPRPAYRATMADVHRMARYFVGRTGGQEELAQALRGISHPERTAAVQSLQLARQRGLLGVV